MASSDYRRAYHDEVKTNAQATTRRVRRSVKLQLRAATKGGDREDIFDPRDNRILTTALGVS